MKIMKKLMQKTLATVLLVPGLALAHPGHQETAFSAGTQHVLSGTEPGLIFLGLALFGVAVFWLLNRR